MIYGHMYWLRETKLSVPEHIQLLIKIHNIENVKYVMVNKLSLNKEITSDNVKIKPDVLVLPNHFWFIQENNSEK
jgi:hypothetical protein